MSRQRTYQVPDEHRDTVRDLSRENNHASLRQTLAHARWQKMMQDVVDDDAAIAGYDTYKAALMLARSANEALWNLLKSLDAAIEAEPENWSLSADDVTLVHDMPKSGATMPSRLIRPGHN